MRDVKRGRRGLLAGVLIVAASCGGGGNSSGLPETVDPPDETVELEWPDFPAVEPGPSAMRRLTASQYRATIADILGDDIEIVGRLEPDRREGGLLAVGASAVSVTSAGFEQYDSIASAVASQAFAPARRGTILSCVPQDPSSADDACAEKSLAQLGRRLFRRPLEATELASRVEIASAAARELGDFHAGLEIALGTLLVSPNFLFRIEELEADENGSLRHTDFSLATRLSYTLWNTAPDEELLDAAETGGLRDDAGLQNQVERMLHDPRLENGVREFFSDLFEFERIEKGLVAKDSILFPAFSQDLLDDAREQTLRVIVEELLWEDGTYPALFTTRNSFMTRRLGVLYRVPVLQTEGWQLFEFPEGGGRAGLLSHASLLSLYAHPGRSSPTLRGLFVREVLLCQEVPAPPGNVDFSMFADAAANGRSTARQRLENHTQSGCAGCHDLMDPIGLGLENMDGIGAWRDKEGGETIDPSGELNGASFADAAELGAVVAADPALGPCLTEHLFRFIAGRQPSDGEKDLLAWIDESAGSSGYRIRSLLRWVVLSDAFRGSEGPRLVEAASS